MTELKKDEIRQLLDGEMPWDRVQEIIRTSKDLGRFQTYLQVMQERVSFSERILLPLAPHLFIVENGTSRTVKCDCSHDFGDYRINWKLSANIYVRDTAELLDEIYPGMRKPDPDWCQIREYSCPSCGVMLEVESLPRGCPPDFEFLPDIDTFYEQWLGQPLPYRLAMEDKSQELIKRWASE